MLILQPAGLDIFNGDLYSGGKVGIGVTSPNEVLEVNGTVKATAFIGDGSGLTGITSTETDPTVPSDIKDGISWTEITGRPAGLDDGDDVGGITTETYPTVDASIKDGVSWTEVTNRPAGLDDGDDVGITFSKDAI